ncbi:hypothetical protein [Nitrincola alkalilacustris]|nr:hypothetical protein [Nitrincola alkalilacustris]
MVQIGLKCSPVWLCDAISWFFGLMFLLAVVGLVVIIIREHRR